MFGLNRAEVIGRLGADITINRAVKPRVLQGLRPRNAPGFNKL